MFYMRKTLAERFFDKVQIGADNDCWPWTGAKYIDGYGSIWYQGQNRKATRILFLIFGKFLPGELSILHKCDNPPCMNPRHLFTGTRADNCRDMGRKGRASRGSEQWNSKLKEEDIPRIRALRAKGKFYKEIAVKFNVHPVTIGDIFRSTTWKHI